MSNKKNYPSENVDSEQLSLNLELNNKTITKTDCKIFSFEEHKRVVDCKTKNNIYQQIVESVRHLYK